MAGTRGAGRGPQVIELMEWAQTHPMPARPWLVLGKGPTFSHVHEVDLAPYNLLALNHVVREIRVHVAHFADLEAIEDCAEPVLTNADWVLMPYRPHIAFRVTERTLADLVATVPVLGELARRGRLVWYNLCTGAPEGDSPVIQAVHFGSEAVVSILALLGVKVVRTLGVDGGRSYSATFQDLAERTLLASGAASYDLQFEGIRRTVEQHGMDFGSLVELLRVFVGTDDSQRVAARVLEYTIRKHASQPVEVVHLDAVEVPLPNDLANRPRTGFSFNRFAIPALCGHQGRALYVDADMLVFGDIADLWAIPMAGHAVLCTRQDAAPEAWRDHEAFQPGPQMSVMLLDCARLPWDTAAIVAGLDEGRYSYTELMFDLCIVPPDLIAATLPPEWNCLERFDPATTRLLHFTVVPTQPWKSDDNPLGAIWLAQYAEAVAAGAVPREEVERGIAAGFLKPALAACLPIAPGPGEPGASTRPEETPRLRTLVLEGRAARGEALMAQARVATLERRLREALREVDAMGRSRTWRAGLLMTTPVRLAQRALLCVAMSRLRPWRWRG